LSREGPAASGGLSSRAGSAPRPSAQGRATEGQASVREGRASGQSPQARGESQAARQESRASAQASRQQSRSSAQAARLEAYDDQHWDEGKGLAIAATGALVAGSAAAISAAAAAPPPAAAPSQFTTPAATPPPLPAAPCANPTVVPAGDVTYTRCGSAWYTLAYGANGAVYVQSAPPPGS
jgi:hypothetical protein